MFKKIVILVAAAVLFAGCTNIESTQKFNAVNLGTNDEKAVCQTFVEMTGLYFFGLPIVVGSAKGDGQCAFFRYNLTNENIVYLLTRAVKSHGANRMINVSVRSSSSWVILPGLSYCNMQGSATGLRSKRAAIKQVQQEFSGNAMY